MPAGPRAHDCLINVHFGDMEQPDWMFRVKDEYFKRGRLHLRQVGDVEGAR